MVIAILLETAIMIFWIVQSTSLFTIRCCNE
jgi:hypothetical protein